MTTSHTDIDHPYYKEIRNEKTKTFDGIKNFFLKDNGKKMKFVSLGEALDFISGGGLNFVGYYLNSREMVKFIITWMKAQEPRIEYEKVPQENGSFTHKKIKKEHFYLWNKFNHESREIISLPLINYPECPRNKEHKKTILDVEGKLRCAEYHKEEFKPSFTTKSSYLDTLSGVLKASFYEDEPQDSTPDEWVDEEGNEVDWSDEYNEYKKEKEKYDSEKPEEFLDVCYSVIKEPKSKSLSLETILNRINCGHNGRMILPFSGFYLAEYVKAWYNQKGARRILAKKREVDYRAFSDFVPISSED